ncbi:hypothetical protein E2562_024432 [Oryza meyeriana var. granulata]|uniref:Sodium/calcium exchanger membrane region domain-containing protein n=1 Tax=Oryza meyeriana var. granulata TaxID=110450 RepID=A0A6G1EYM0_9ORYZ|nr:hypothetical protein E2562_024432 [Oryza meyeriana var. granulata]
MERKTEVPGVMGSKSLTVILSTAGNIEHDFDIIKLGLTASLLSKVEKLFREKPNPADLETAKAILKVRTFFELEESFSTNCQPDEFNRHDERAGDDEMPQKSASTNDGETPPKPVSSSDEEAPPQPVPRRGGAGNGKVEPCNSGGPGGRLDAADQPTCTSSTLSPRSERKGKAQRARGREFEPVAKRARRPSVRLSGSEWVCFAGDLSPPIRVVIFHTPRALRSPLCMARPAAKAAPAPAARVVIDACVNVAFLLLLAFFFISPRGGTPLEVVSSKEGGDWAVGIRWRSGGGSGGVFRVERCEHVAEDGFGRRRYPRGYVDYLYLFYCVFGEERRVLAYGVMAAWLAVLFYLLGDTAAVYFCSSLEGLSRLLRLSPAIAGVTLLSLGNGAPDALSTIASFATGDGGGEGETTAVGLNGVLGSSMLVSSAVLGIIGIHLGGRGVAVDRVSFYRDASFLLVALAAVGIVLSGGEVTVLGALAFTSLYAFYVLAVAFTNGRATSKGHEAEADHTAAAFSELCNVAETKFHTNQEPLLPETAPLLDYYADDGDSGGSKKKIKSAFWSVLRALEFPLWLPRRLTIPDASKERWSKPAAVTAVTLGPAFLSLLCSHASGSTSPLAVLLGLFTGAILGLFAFFTTTFEAPPTDHLAAWLAGGFVMSVAWSYAVASELLALLVCAAHVMGVDSASLGLTVLAWGNSLGDLVTNLAVASRGGGGAAQVAVAGCYGGPVFDVLVGLGVSLLLSTWAARPRPVAMPRDAGLFQTLGFAAGGICWAVVVMSRRGMRVDRTVGFGLLAIYLCFLCINISQALGLV